jgi:hypothetical protein
LADQLGSWESKLYVPESADDPLDHLRQVLEPVRQNIPSSSPPPITAPPSKAPADVRHATRVQPSRARKPSIYSSSNFKGKPS